MEQRPCFRAIRSCTVQAPFPRYTWSFGDCKVRYSDPTAGGPRKRSCSLHILPPVACGPSGCNLQGWRALSLCDTRVLRARPVSVRGAGGVAFAETWSCRAGISLHADDVINGGSLAQTTCRPMRRKNFDVEMFGYDIPRGGSFRRLVCPWRPRTPREGAKRSQTAVVEGD